MKKRFLALLLAGTMVVSLAACGSKDNQGDAPTGSSGDAQQSSEAGSGPEESTPDEPTPDPAPISGFSEAPMLADLVAAGTLPKVEDRLPAEDDVFVDQTDAAGGGA